MVALASDSAAEQELLAGHARRFEWERIVRRVEMHSTAKFLALTLATYADQDGTRIHPGAERLGRVMCVSDRTVKRHLVWLRTEGFIRRTKQGNRWAGLADEYRLTLPLNLLERDLLDPDEAPSPSVTSGTQSYPQGRSLGGTGDT